MKPVAPLDERLAELSSKHRCAIRRYVLSIVRDPAVADDLTQETFLRAFRNLETLRDDSRLTAWLYRIATNICRDRFRNASCSPQTLSIETPSRGGSRSIVEAIPNTDHPPLDQWVGQHEMSVCVQEHVRELPDSYRSVILLHDVAGMTDSEIANMLHCSLGTVKIRLHRARAKLKSLLEGGCDFSTDQRGVLVCEPKD